MSSRPTILAVLLAALVMLPLLPPTQADQVVTPVYDHVVAFASAAQVVAAGGTIIDDYGAFLTARLTQAQADALRGQGANVVLVDHNMGLGQHYGDWKLSPPTIPVALRADETSEIWLVQFRGPIREAWTQTLTDNALAVYDYVPNNARLAKLTAMQRTILAGLPYVRHLEPFHPALKLGAGVPEDGVQLYDALARGSADRAALVSSVVAAGGAIELQLTAGPSHVIRFLGDPAVVTSVASLSSVFAVDRVEPSLLLATGRSSLKLQVNTTLPDTAVNGTRDSYRIHQQGVDGHGQIAGVCDTGVYTVPSAGGTTLLTRHASLFDAGTNGTVAQIPFPSTTPLQHRKLEIYYAPEFPPGTPHGDGLDAESWHGTRTASIVGGDRSTEPGAGWDELSARDGVAFRARLAVCDLHVTNPTLHEITGADGNPILHQHTLDVFTYGIPDPDVYFGPGYAVGARVFSNSWGTGRLVSPGVLSPPYAVGPAYTIGSHLIDEYVRKRPELTMVYATGNTGRNGVGNTNVNTPGLFHPEAVAKNTLGIGATTIDHQHVAPFSAWSPCDVPVIKPDLVAQGADVESAIGRTDGEISHVFDGFDGTSYSTPAVAGAAVLIRDYLLDGYHTTGRRGEGAPLEPAASLVRAMLAASARAIQHDPIPNDPRFCEKRPNAIQGWGMPVLDNVLYFAGDGESVLLWNESQVDAVHVGQTWERTIAVQQGKPLRVFLAWTDLPGLPYSPLPLVNNLDLVLTPQGGEPILANNITGIPDVRNTIEGVILPSAAASSYKIEVIGRNVPFPEQRFSVAVVSGYGVGEAPAP